MVTRPLQKVFETALPYLPQSLLFSSVAGGKFTKESISLYWVAIYDDPSNLPVAIDGQEDPFQLLLERTVPH